MSDTSTQPRFILVDPSAIHTGGHHYEYATRILNEARANGYDPELWAHKDADLPQDAFPVKVCMSNSFYQNLAPQQGTGLFKALLNGGFIAKLTGIIAARVRTIFGKIVLENTVGISIARVKHDAVRGIYKPQYNHSYHQVKTPPALYMVLYAGYKLYKTLFQYRCMFFKLAKIMVIIAAVLTAPLWLPLLIMVGVFLLFKSNKLGVAEILAHDIKKALSTKQWNAHDIIFIPTCLHVETNAMVELLSKWSPNKTLPQFHLLYRTNIFSGYSDTFRNQLEANLPLRAAFKWLLDGSYKNNLFFYTDTPQLSAQYQVLTDTWFEPLPVPVPWDSKAEARPETKSCLNIAYVGDVRDEKGYQFYPQMLDFLSEEYIKTGRVRFILQSNFADNLDVSRESAVAQSILRSYDSSVVTHVKGPLNSTGYKKLIDSSDIILLTYAPDNYMARSSGIFIEAMKAGKPVIMPARTWMAAEIEPYRQAVWAKMLQTKSYQKIALASALSLNEMIKVVDKKTYTHVMCRAKFDIVKGQTGFAEITVKCADDMHISYAVNVAQVMDNGEVLLCVPTPNVEPCAEISLKLSGANGRLIEVDVFASNEHYDAPLGFAAAIYPYQEQNYINEAMKELIDNFDAYRAGAHQFCVEKGMYYTPEFLVKRIVEFSQKMDD